METKENLNQPSSLVHVLGGLMRRYRKRVPDVKLIQDALVNYGAVASAKTIANDHIAFRTMGVPLLGIQSLERIFMYYGYIKKEHYHFPQKKLNAYWYSPPQEQFPRVFISELRVDELSENAKKIIHSYTKEVIEDPTKNMDLDNPEVVDSFLHSSLWRLPSKKDYNTLLEESEYAAWVIYSQYYLNHYTISVHELNEAYNTLESFNMLMKKIGITLNTSGGVIKKSGDGSLLQSATVAHKIEATFAQGETDQIAGSYVEFAERKVLNAYAHLPQNEIKREHRRDGFEASNADKIFESTYRSQVNKQP